MKQAIIVIDLGFGDQGKGTIVDALARHHQAHTVIRFGGPQAGHGVITPDGRYHIFAQFGSATFVEGVETFLSKYMVIEPWRMMAEEEALQKLGLTDAFERTLVSAEALVITPFHAAANRLREFARGASRHGSCGLGVGETKKDALEVESDLIVRAQDLNRPNLAETFRRVQQFKREQLWKEGVIKLCWQLPEAQEDIHLMLSEDVHAIFIDALTEFNCRARVVPDESVKDLLAKDGTVICELSQGVLLDEWRGFHPYTTWGTCTPDQAISLLHEANHAGVVRKLGVVRAYATRHGPGPFVTEDFDLTNRLPDPKSARGEWQGQFRVGHFDCVSTRYAIAACGGIDSLAITCLDRLRDERVWNVCTHYERAEEDQDSDLFNSGIKQTRLVSEMNLGTFQDLAYQERLTQSLSNAVQVLFATSTSGLFEERVKHHVDRILSELNVPISILSFGPTVTDKKFL